MTSLQGMTLKLAEKRTAESKLAPEGFDEDSVSGGEYEIGLVPLLAILGGIVLALTGTAFSILLVVKRRGGGEASEGRNRYNIVQMAEGTNIAEMECLAKDERQSPNLVSCTNGK